MSRPDGQFWFLILFVLSILAHLIFPVRTVIAPPFTYTGIALIGTGLILGFWTRSLFLKNRTTLSPFITPAFLVTSGPFRVSRNPAYLGMAAILLGLALILGTAAPFAMPILFILIIEIFFIPAEERMLENRFGEQYRIYQANVRRWL